MIGFLIALMLVAAPEQKPAKRSKPAKPPQTTLTGCVDERGEAYVLTGDRELRRVATLEGAGFSNDNFARYVGHKVTVHGKMAGETFRVSKIDDLGAGCAPEERRQQK